MILIKYLQRLSPLCREKIFLLEIALWQFILKKIHTLKKKSKCVKHVNNSTLFFFNISEGFAGIHCTSTFFITKILNAL